MSNKSILILKGSPREKGNSSALADQVMAGAKTVGAQVESFVLQNMFRYIRANIAGMVHGTAMNVGDAQKQPDLMEQAYKLGQKLAGTNLP